MADECCIAEVNLLKQEIDDSTNAIKKLKEEYKDLLIKNLQKDVIIRELKQKLGVKKYCNFENILSESCLGELRCIGTSVKDDSKFIAVVLKDLYVNTDSLKQKCLSGRSKSGDKSQITPEKKVVLEKVYSERMSNLPKTEVKERANNLSKIIRNVIDCTNRKK